MARATGRLKLYRARVTQSMEPGTRLRWRAECGCGLTCQSISHPRAIRWATSHLRYDHRQR